MSFTLLTLLIASGALAMGLGLWGWTRRAARIRLRTPEDLRARAKRGGYRLLTTTELAGLYREQGDGLILVDTREPEPYRAGHIAGACNFPLAPTRRRRLQAAHALATLLGPDPARLVVFY